jgi:outer membrane lipoprotein-sorting protein
MKIILVMLLTMLCLAAGPITADSSVDDVLDALDARGKDLKTMSADVKMTDIDPSVGDVGDIRTGRLFYKVLPTGDARWRAVFDKKITGRKLEEVKHEWAYADGKLIERDFHNKTQITRQILKPGEKMQLFNLEGPFPLPLGQDKADVHKHFDAQKVPLAKDDPATTTTAHLQLTPTAGTDLARKFTTIDLWVDPKTDMPIRITVLDGNKSNLRQTDLSNVKVNEQINDGDFELEKVDVGGWELHDEGMPSQ